MAVAAESNPTGGDAVVPRPYSRQERTMRERGDDHLGVGVFLHSGYALLLGNALPAVFAN